MCIGVKMCWHYQPPHRACESIILPMRPSFAEHPWTHVREVMGLLVPLKIWYSLTGIRSASDPEGCSPTRGFERVPNGRLWNNHTLGVTMCVLLSTRLLRSAHPHVLPLCMMGIYFSFPKPSECVWRQHLRHQGFCPFQKVRILIMLLPKRQGSIIIKLGKNS